MDSSQRSSTSDVKCNTFGMVALGFVLLYLYVSQVNPMYSFSNTLNNYIVKTLIVFLALYSVTQCLNTSVLGAIITIIIFIVLNMITGKDVFENFGIMDDIKSYASSALNVVQQKGSELIKTAKSQEMPKIELPNLSNLPNLPNQLPNVQSPKLPSSPQYDAMLQRFNVNNLRISQNAENEVALPSELGVAENLNGYNISGLVPSLDNTNRPSINFEEVSKDMNDVNKFLYDLRQTGSPDLVHGMPSELNNEFVNSEVDNNTAGIQSVYKYAPVLADSAPESGDKFIQNLCGNMGSNNVQGVYEGGSFENI